MAGITGTGGFGLGAQVRCMCVKLGSSGQLCLSGQPSSQTRHHTMLIHNRMNANTLESSDQSIRRITHMASPAISARVAPHVDCSPTAAQAECLARAGLDGCCTLQ